MGAASPLTDADVSINASVISYNRVENGQGGGLYADQSVAITGSAIFNNQAFYGNDANPVLGYGGGLYMSGGQLDNVTVSDNDASYSGGGVFNNGGALTVRNGSRVNTNDLGAGAAVSSTMAAASSSRIARFAAIPPGEVAASTMPIPLPTTPR